MTDDDLECVFCMSKLESSHKTTAFVADPQEHNVIPSVTAPDVSSEFKKTASGQNKVAFMGIPKTMLSSMRSPKESELPNEIPLVIHIRSLQENYSSKNVNAVWCYCNLRETENEKYEVLVMKKMVACTTSYFCSCFSFFQNRNGSTSKKKLSIRLRSFAMLQLYLEMQHYANQNKMKMHQQAKGGHTCYKICLEAQ